MNSTPDKISYDLPELGLLVADHVTAMLAYWDKHQVCRFANNAYRHWFGKSREEMVGKMTMKELLGPLYDKNLPFITGALNGIAQQFEREIPISDSEIRYSIANYYPDIVNGEVRGFFVHVADISSVKKLEKELAASEQKFRGILESAPDAIVIVNTTGTMEIVNAQTEKLFGYTRDELRLQQIEILFSECFKNQHVGFVQLLSATIADKTAGLELVGLHKNQKEFPIEISTSSIQLEDGLYLSVSIRDITERKKAEEKLRNYSILESKNKEMEQFAYIASHDLREPLLTIKGFAELLSEDYANLLDDGGKYYTDSIVRAVMRMDVLIKGLLDYTRLGQVKQLEQTDCNQLIKDVLADLQYLISSTNATINITQLPDLKAYPLELKILFQNLIGNALKFTTSGTLPLVNISAIKIVHGWQFEVNDNGIGIESQDKEKIFNIFQRLHPTDKFAGTGLGLALCKKIAELHNGKIWVKSEPYVGSSFYFTILTEST